jgi:DNA-binding transcriptional MerR regulator
MPSSARTLLTIADLARLADVTPRTVRYYVAQGLLPSPGQAGPSARYPEAALSRLRLIRELQRSHLPLAEIRTRLAGLSDAEVTALSAQPSPEPTDTALDYIRGILRAARPAEPPSLAHSNPGAAAPAPAMAVAPGDMPAAERGRRATPSMLRSAPPSDDAALPAAASSSGPGTVERSQWDRIALTPDIELHIRRPLGRLEQRRAERLITIARQVLKEDTQ